MPFTGPSSIILTLYKRVCFYTYPPPAAITCKAGRAHEQKKPLRLLFALMGELGDSVLLVHLWEPVTVGKGSQGLKHQNNI